MNIFKNIFGRFFHAKDIVEQIDKEKDLFANFQFPIVKNIQPRTLAQDLDSIPTEDMPRRMSEMFSQVSLNARKTILKELEEIRGKEDKKERVEYLEKLLNSPICNMDKNL